MSTELKSKTIKVSSQTYAELAKQGTVEDSFDTVIQKLLKQQSTNKRDGV